MSCFMSCNCVKHDIILIVVPLVTMFVVVVWKGCVVFLLNKLTVDVGNCIIDKYMKIYKQGI